MRKTWMFSVIAMGCLVGLPGCTDTIGGLFSSALSNTVLGVITAVFGSLLSGLIPAAS